MTLPNLFESTHVVPQSPHTIETTLHPIVSVLERAMTIFSLTPTFTQGLIIGQLSILLLLAFILRYLFFDTKPVPPEPSPGLDIDGELFEGEEKKDKASAFSDRLRATARPLNSQKDSFLQDYPTDATREESVEWFNFLIDGVCSPCPCQL